MATVTNLKSHVDNWKCGDAPITSMMTVTGWLRGPAASQIGKPIVHMASVDLYDFSSILFSTPFLLATIKCVLFLFSIANVGQDHGCAAWGGARLDRQGARLLPTRQGGSQSVKNSLMPIHGFRRILKRPRQGRPIELDLNLGLLLKEFTGLAQLNF